MIDLFFAWLTNRTGEQVAAGVYVFALIWCCACLYHGHRTGKINLWDTVTSTDRTGAVRTDAKRLYLAGAFVVMTATLALLAVISKLSEWYAFLYVGAFVVADIGRNVAQIKQQQVANAAATQPEKPS